MAQDGKHCHSSQHCHTVRPGGPTCHSSATSSQMLASNLVACPNDSLSHAIFLDNQQDAQRGTRNFYRSVFQGLDSVGYPHSYNPAICPTLDVPAIVQRLQEHMQGVNDFGLYCPRAPPSVGVVSCTYHQWFRPYSKRRRYCQLPVSGRRMQRFLQFRLASHTLPIVSGRFAGGQHVSRPDRICSHCDTGSIADDLHMVHECSALQPVRQRYMSLFTSNTDTMRSFFGQKDHVQVFNFILDCLDYLEV